MSTDTPSGYFSKKTVAIGAMVGVLLILALIVIFKNVLIALAVTNQPRMPKDSPIEVAGNSAHICTPYLPTTSTPVIANTTDAYLANPDGSSRQVIALTRPWKTIRINNLTDDLSAIDIAAADLGPQGIPLTITSHFPTQPSSDGHSNHSVCPGPTSECVQLGDITFNDARGKAITMIPCMGSPSPGAPPVGGKCLLMLGPLQAVSVAYGCMNQ